MRAANVNIVRLCLALAVLAAGAPGWAQSYHCRTYTVDDGLPSPAVHALAQDLRGRMWFATGAGIACFDGVKWTVFGPRELPSRTYSHLSVDGSGRVWALAPGSEQALASYDGQSWRSVTGAARLVAPTVRVTAFEVASTPQGPLVAVGTETSGLWLWHEGTWRCFDADRGVPEGEIRALEWRRDGSLAMATRQHLCSFTFKDGAVDCSMTERLPMDEVELLGIREDDDSDALWVLSTGGLGVLERDGYRPVSGALGLRWSSEILPTLVIDSPRQALCADQRSVVLVNLGTGDAEYLGRDTGLANRGATDIAVDREGGLWVAGLRGVTRVASLQFASYRREQGLLEDEVTAICEPRPGVLVFGHGGGLTVLRGSEMRTVTFPVSRRGGAASSRVLDLWSDGDGGVWVAASELGLARLDSQGSMSWFGREQGLESPVTSVVRDSGGELLVGTNRGVFVLDQGHFRLAEWCVAEKIWTRRLFRCRDGSLAVASSGLVMVSDGRVVGRLALPQDDRSGVFAFLEDTRGRVWVGARTGLYQVAGGSLQRPLEEPYNAVDEPVYFIYEDGHDRLWFGTDHGLVRIDDSGLRRFTVRDGLAGRECNRAAGFADSEGRFWVGTDGGVSRYRPEHERLSWPPPNLWIDGIETSSGGAKNLEAMSLPHSENDLVFRYCAVSFIGEGGLHYRYRLEGLDSEWSPVLDATARSARYANLAPGRYRFHVKAANAAGVWSEPVSSSWITISRPFWTCWWFFMAAGAAFGLLAYSGAASVLKWRYAIRLEAEVRDRTNELRESEERYRQLFEHSVSAKVLIDMANRRVMDANRLAIDMLAAEAGDLIGANTAEIGDGWLDRVVAEYLAEGAAETYHRHLSVRNAAGARRELEVWGNPLVLQGRRHLLTTMRDVTETARLQEESIRASKVESVGLLAGGIAHDFNNVLAAALGRVSLARMRLARGTWDIRALLEQAESTLLRARNLTSQLLTFAKGGEPVREALDLSVLVSEAVGMVRAGLRSQCRLELEPDLWVVHADGGQIRQIVTSLVINADQSMPWGGEIVIRLDNLTVEEGDPRTIAPGSYLRLAVIDRGEGIPSEIINHVVDPYFTTRQERSGLGLTAAYAIAAKHGGLLEIESSIDEGTTVTVLLPADPSAPKPAVSAALELVRGSGRVLAMDDESALRALYRDVLPLLGYEVETAEDGGTAVALYTRALKEGCPYVAVIMDLTVPAGMGGKEALNEIKKIDPEVRAIVASGYSNDPVMARYRDVGFSGALPKPFSVAQLSRVLGEVTQSSDASSAE